MNPEARRLDVGTSNAPGGVLEPGRRILLESERKDLEEQQLSRRAAARRHTLWALLGVSPTAAIPLLAATRFGVGMFAILSLCVAVVEAWNAIRAHMDATDIEGRLKRLSSTLDQSAS